MKWGDTSNKCKHHLLDGGSSDYGTAVSLDDVIGADIDLTMPDGQLAAFVRGRFAASQRQAPRDKRPQGDRERAPPRGKADMTCPNCLEKGHTSQECKKPKLELKDRRCFICNEPGHPASKCPKAHLKALTRGQPPPADRGGSGGPARKVLMSLEDSDGYVPAHRLMKKLTSWSQATAKPTPTTLTVNAVVESAFMELARREAEAVEAPPAAIGQRPSWKKGARNKHPIPLRSLVVQLRTTEALLLAIRRTR